MPSINRSHDDLALIASGLRQALLADELLGLLAAGFEVELNITSLSPGVRQALHELAADLEAVVQEHESPTADEVASAAHDATHLTVALMVASGKRACADGVSFDVWLEHVEQLVKEFMA